LLGIAGRNKDYLARLWQELLFKTGSHVMTADSSLSYDFNKASGHGVAGNLEADAQAIAKVIEAFLNTPEARDKVSEVRLLGSSYGGNIALYLAKLSKEGKLNFPLGPSLCYPRQFRCAQRPGFWMTSTPRISRPTITTPPSWSR